MPPIRYSVEKKRGGITVLLVKNGRVHDGLGNVRVADIRIENGKIAEVAPDLPPDGSEIFDAAGHEILPGFVNALSYWGIFGPGWSGHDHEELSHPVTPQLDVTYAFDHDGMNFQKVYTYGVTSAGVAPVPRNVLAGQAAVYKTHGRTPHAMLVRPRTAMIASITRAVKKAYEGRNVMPMTKMGAFSLLIEQLTKAARYDAGKNPDDLATQAMLPVLRGEQPLFVNCAGEAEIEAVLTALEPFDQVQLVLTGAYGVNRTSLGLTKRPVGIILGDRTEGMNEKIQPADYEHVLDLWGDANIAIGCAGDDQTAGRESLLWNAILWHKHGLHAEACLEAITARPAELLGVGDRIGSIKPGLDADLTIWTKHPIESYEATLTAVFIDGANVLTKEAYASCW